MASSRSKEPASTRAAAAVLVISRAMAGVPPPFTTAIALGSRPSRLRPNKILGAAITTVLIRPSSDTSAMAVISTAPSGPARAWAASAAGRLELASWVMGSTWSRARLISM